MPSDETLSQMKIRFIRLVLHRPIHFFPRLFLQNGRQPVMKGLVDVRPCLIEGNINLKQQLMIVANDLQWREVIG